jgi:hypothetical protein
METKVDRLVDYFSVIGLGENLQPNSLDKETGEILQKASVYPEQFIIHQIDKSQVWRF